MSEKKRSVTAKANDAKTFQTHNQVNFFDKSLVNKPKSFFDKFVLKGPSSPGQSERKS